MYQFGGVNALSSGTLDAMAERDGRARVLAALRAQPRALDVREVARLVGLHVNTVRFHLEGLVDEGEAERSTVHTGGRGRPRTVYEAGPDPAVSDRAHRLLAEVLTDATAGGVTPRFAGEVKGRQLFPDDGSAGTRQAVVAVAGELDEMGFVTEVVPGEMHDQLLIRRCPFADLARRSPEVVCGVHLGVLNGMLDAARTGVKVVELSPFVADGSCRAVLAPVGGVDRGTLSA